MLIILFGWIVIGVLAGFLASKVVTGHGRDVVTDIVFGIGGALIGGWIFKLVAAGRVPPFSFWSLPAAAGGAVLMVGIWRTVRSKALRE
jgi:uncharacterized membrane protein YeaQ/YmgE (transglycosylase-associated protein family)